MKDSSAFINAENFKNVWALLDTVFTFVQRGNSLQGDSVFPVGC